MGYLLDQYDNESWYAEVKSAYEDATEPEEWVVYQSAYKSTEIKICRQSWLHNRSYMVKYIRERDGITPSLFWVRQKSKKNWAF